MQWFGIEFSMPPSQLLTSRTRTYQLDYSLKQHSEFLMFPFSVYIPEICRNILGTRSLSDILSDRDEIAAVMQNLLADTTARWGIKVERVEIKDVRLPVQLQRSMAREAESARDARAKVIASEGERLASRALREAAKIIAESPSAIQLRYLQTLNNISSEKNQTIILPLPIELLRYFTSNRTGT
ncbi:hypothetical protein M3Y95_00680100 [Aphelenchoides besseyi]|nr:hypothetical protein M3Y95_00680100 [Aphelenchoides besseyi]